MIYGLKSSGVNVIPPDVGLGIVVRRRSVVAGSAATATAPSPPAGPLLPAGTDKWYGVPSYARIPFRAYDHALCADTDLTACTLDDDVQSEATQIDDAGPPVPAVGSAWWEISVPLDASPGWVLDLDTWLTTGGTQAGVGSAEYPGPLSYPTDTNLAVYTTDADVGGPFSYGPGGGVDFMDIYLVDHSSSSASDDDPDPTDPDHPWLSSLTVNLEPGKVYWIRVDTYDFTDPSDPLIVRLRVNLHPGT